MQPGLLGMVLKGVMGELDPRKLATRTYDRQKGILQEEQTPLKAALMQSQAGVDQGYKDLESVMREQQENILEAGNMAPPEIPGPARLTGGQAGTVLGTTLLASLLGARNAGAAGQGLTQGYLNAADQERTVQSQQNTQAYATELQKLKAKSDALGIEKALKGMDLERLLALRDKDLGKVEQNDKAMQMLELQKLAAEGKIDMQIVEGMFEKRIADAKASRDAKKEAEEIVNLYEVLRGVLGMSDEEARQMVTAKLQQSLAYAGRANAQAKETSELLPGKKREQEAEAKLAELKAQYYPKEFALKERELQLKRDTLNQRIAENQKIEDPSKARNEQIKDLEALSKIISEEFKQTEDELKAIREFRRGFQSIGMSVPPGIEELYNDAIARQADLQGQKLETTGKLKELRKNPPKRTPPTNPFDPVDPTLSGAFTIKR